MTSPSERIRFTPRESLENVNKLSQIEFNRIVAAHHREKRARVDLAHRQAVRFEQIVKLDHGDHAAGAGLVDDKHRRFAGNLSLQVAGDQPHGLIRTAAGR